MRRAYTFAMSTVTREPMLDLVQQNAVLTARIAELTHALARAEAFTKLHGGVVHDLRNAFHVALMAAETLSVSLDDPIDRDLAKSILTAAEHGSALARDLLALTRKEDSSTSLVDCADCIARLRRLIHRFEVEQIECHYDISPDVGSVLVERAQLEAALINLTVNAREAMPDGGQLHIGLRRVPPGAQPEQLPAGEYIEFAIADTGSGMSPSVLAHATEAFFTTKGSKGGTGLGLAMAESFAARSGGALLLESEPEHGTVVRIVLPSAAPENVAEATPELSAKVAEIASHIRTPGLRQALQQWRSLCRARQLPRALELEARLTSQADHLLVLDVDPDSSPPALHLSRIGAKLAAALGQRSLGELPLEGATTVGTLAAAYRRAFQSRFPSYEYASYTFDETPPAVFERLILPASVGGNAVTHLLGLVYLSESLHAKGE